MAICRVRDCTEIADTLLELGTINHKVGVPICSEHHLEATKLQNECSRRLQVYAHKQIVMFMEKIEKIGVHE